MHNVSLENARAHEQDLLRLARRERIARPAGERRPLRYRLRLGWPVRHRDALLPALDPRWR